MKYRSYLDLPEQNVQYLFVFNRSNRLPLDADSACQTHFASQNFDVMKDTLGKANVSLKISKIDIFIDDTCPLVPRFYPLEFSCCTLQLNTEIRYIQLNVTRHFIY